MKKANDILIENLHREMLKRQWKPADLADATGLSRSGLYKTIEGTTWPSPDNLDRIARAFNLQPFELLMPEGMHPLPKEHDLTECARRVAEAAARLTADCKKKKGNADHSGPGARDVREKDE